MAIPKLSSKDLNSILENAQNSMKDLQEEVGQIKDDTNEKMAVLKNEQEYALRELLRLSNLLNDNQDGEQVKGLRNKALLASETKARGIYDVFGSTVHRQFLRQPINVFNLMTTNGPMYRDNAEVAINGVKRESYKHALVHTASPDKRISFGEYDSSELKLELVIDRGNLLGDTNFNVIELDPYLPGSFNIKELMVYEIHGQGAEPSYTLRDVDRIGSSRILLDRKYELVKLELTLELTFRNGNGKYPFGLKHMYFLNADFNPDSYITAKIEKSNFIETIGEDIIVRDQFGKRFTTLRDEGVKLYLSETNGLLEYELETSNHHLSNPLSRNTREFYARIPLQNYSIVSIEFSKIISR